MSERAYQAALKAYTARGESRTYSVFEDRLRLAVEAAIAALAQSDAGPHRKPEWRSTPEMRTRIRELARPNSDDYDRAVIAVLDDFENMLDGSGLDDGPWLPGQGPRKKAARKMREEMAAIRAKAWETRRARAADKMLNASGPKDIATGWPLPDRAADRNGKP